MVKKYSSFDKIDEIETHVIKVKAEHLIAYKAVKGEFDNFNDYIKKTGQYKDKETVIVIADLSEVTIDGEGKTLDLTDINLQGSILRGAKFNNCNLEGANFRDTDLTNALFDKKCNLNAIDLRGADLTNIKLDLTNVSNPIHLSYASMEVLEKINKKDEAQVQLAREKRDKLAKALQEPFPGKSIIEFELTREDVEKFIRKNRNLDVYKKQSLYDYALEKLFNELNLKDEGLTIDDLKASERVFVPSLQGLDLSGIPFKDLDLRHCDFTNANFTDAGFCDCKLLPAAFGNDPTFFQSVGQLIGLGGVSNPFEKTNFVGSNAELNSKPKGKSLLEYKQEEGFLQKVQKSPNEIYLVKSISDDVLDLSLITSKDNLLKFDPTYKRGANAKEASAKKRLVSLTKEDLEKFLKLEPKISLKQHARDIEKERLIAARDKEKQKLLERLTEGSPISIELAKQLDKQLEGSSKELTKLDKELKEFEEFEIVPDLRKIQDMQKWVFKDHDLSGSVFSGVNLSGTEFSKCYMFGCNFQACNMQDVLIKEVNLDYSNLTHADLSGVSIENSSCIGALGPKVNLASSHIKQSELGGAQLPYAILKGSTLTDVGLENANLTGASLEYAKLEKVRLQYAILNNAVLRECEIIGSNLSHAYMKGADLAKSKMKDAIMHNIKAAGIDLSDAELEKVFMDGADLSGGKLQGMTATGLSLRKAYLDGVNASCSVFKELNMKEAHLRLADLSYAVVTNVNAAGADLKCAILNDMTFRGDNNNFRKGNFTGATCLRLLLEGKVSFAEAILNDATTEIDKASKGKANVDEAISNLGTQFVNPEKFTGKVNDVHMGKVTAAEHSQMQKASREWKAPVWVKKAQASGYKALAFATGFAAKLSSTKNLMIIGAVIAIPTALSITAGLLGSVVATYGASAIPIALVVGVGIGAATGALGGLAVAKLPDVITKVFKVTRVQMFLSAAINPIRKYLGISFLDAAVTTAIKPVSDWLENQKKSFEAKAKNIEKELSANEQEKIEKLIKLIENTSPYNPEELFKEIRTAMEAEKNKNGSEEHVVTTGQGQATTTGQRRDQETGSFVTKVVEQRGGKEQEKTSTEPNKSTVKQKKTVTFANQKQSKTPPNQQRSY